MAENTYIRHSWKNGEVINATKLNNIENGIEQAIHGGGGGSDGVVDLMVEITYDELKYLRNAGMLRQGQQYRITDYVCTVANDEGAMVESHPYDIIVVADSNSTLNENARAVIKDNDDYYNNGVTTDAKLEAWELKYSLDNDTDRFGWADDTNGKGVVYQLKDDKNNECWYDFKQIKFKKLKVTQCRNDQSFVGCFIDPEAQVLIEVTTEEDWRFTFDNYPGASTDTSNYILGNDNSCSFENIIGFAIDFSENPKYVLGHNVLINCNRNVLSRYCQFNTINNKSSENTLGKQCMFNTLARVSCNNKLGNCCNNNLILSQCDRNEFNSDCSYNLVKSLCQYIKLDLYCTNNIFGGSCERITFGINCQSNEVTANSKNYIIIDNGIHGLTNADFPSIQHIGITQIGRNSNNTIKFYNPMDSAT